MTKQQTYSALSRMDSEIHSLADVITNYMPNPTRKLKALYGLVTTGHDVRSGNTLGTIRIDGEQHSLSILDTMGPARCGTMPPSARYTEDDGEMGSGFGHDA